MEGIGKMESEYSVFCEEELFPEDQLLAVEKLDENDLDETIQDMPVNVASHDLEELDDYSVIAYDNSILYNNVFLSDLHSPQRYPSNTLMSDSQIDAISKQRCNYYRSLIANHFFNVDSLQIINNNPSESIITEEEQQTVNIKEDSIIPFKITDNTVKTDIEVNTVQEEIQETEFKCPTTLPVLTHELNKRKTRNAKRKNKRKDSVTKINLNIKSEEQEDCIDVETIPQDEVPVLEAVDVNSLLEKFEASENSNLCNKSTVKNNHIYDTRSNKTCRVTQECRTDVTEKSVSQASNQPTVVQTSILSKNVINKIKPLERKRTIPIAAMPNIQGKNRSARMQDGAPSNKVLKTSSTVLNNVNSRSFSSTSIQLDHDYCNANFHTNDMSCNSNKNAKHTSILKSSQNKNWDKFEEHDNNVNSNEQCNSELANVCVASQKSRQKLSVLKNKINDNWLENNSKDCQKETPSKQPETDDDSSNNSSSVKDINVMAEHPTTSLPVIRSALANRIIQRDLQAHRSVLSKTNIAISKTQYISVLKNPPNAPQSSLNNLNENIVTTTDSLNNKIENVIVQNTEDTLLYKKEETNAPQKKKILNLDEYYNRKDKNRNNKITAKPSPTKLVAIFHVSTNLNVPINRNNPKASFCCEREYTQITKKISEIIEEKNKPKPSTRDIKIGTDEPVFEFLNPMKENVEDLEKNDEKRQESTRNKQKSYESEDHNIGSNKQCNLESANICNASEKLAVLENKMKDNLLENNREDGRKDKRVSSSSSRSRSKSRSRSRSRSRRRRSRDRRRSRSRSKSRSRSRRSKSRARNRNRSSSSDPSSRSTSRSRSRSSSRNRRSRRRSNTRRRTISHRRSSVTSWSSSSRSKYSSRSRSRSRVRSRSRSRSSGRYYSSRSRSPSSLRRGRSSSHERKNRERSCDRYERRSFAYRYDHRNRSPRNYHKPYDNWYDREKQSEVEERRVVFVGRIEEGITKADLRRRFETFGPVINISLHFRERGDNYGFVTFKYNTDAYRAVEHGNDDPSLPRYDLSFGGRRVFCKSTYTDLDNMGNNSPRPQNISDVPYDILLKETVQMCKRKV
ncbi:PREDICTED: homeobox protein 2 [Wasmannia auropunctata]|uniref:homeobox protein 2 n=1 Tax=Wasmannia auropunctata TaxID=64793 RepID=UPI0005F066F9|nr:PREDICTED: homeobox protein 2 [Wasmannia auropunctata]XP_011691899.1 PREDICTED: homeobox protein 2 [Wasmannia auropunctata]XP_011691900.1 PREDICTED: homeobox protein 2 [Wasmannia auropunctata]XP_011691901.1 PREDICTED: homeobox protein 2 [Wasmannia auropunctata]